MTRGPLPKKAITKAREIALDRGILLDTGDLADSHYEFSLFCPGSTVYVHIRRIRRHVATPQDIEQEYGEDVGRIRRVPETPVASREIWVLSPWGTWQFFRVHNDCLVEIRRDGAPAAGPAPGSTLPAAQK